MKNKSIAYVWLLALLCRTASAQSVTVPMRLLGNFPVITARIDGIDVPLAFDLGDASALVLAQSVIDRAKAMPATETHRAKDAMGNVIQSATFTLPRIEIGNAVFTNVIVRPDLHDPSYQASEVGQQGYLGTALLQSYKVVLDYRHRTFTLISPTSTDKKLPTCEGVAVPFLSGWNGSAVTTVTTDFGELTAVWDTGSPVSILRKANAHKLSDSVIDESATTKRFVLGGSDFGPLDLVVADYTEPAGTDMFIGYSFFINHIVCIDFPGKRFLIQH